MNLLALWDSVWIALLTSAILFGAYRALEWRWPERYIGISQTFGLSSQETLLRFVLYRAVPMYVLVATCLVTVERVGGYIWAAGAVIWLASIAATHGRVVVESVLQRRGETNYAGYHLAMIVLLTLTVLISIFTRQTWGLIVSPPAEMLSALWSGVLVAGFGGFVIFAIQPRSEESRDYGPIYLVERATRDVGMDVMDWLYAECRRTGADPVFLKALLVVEAVQRPKWLRAIERLGVKIGVARTSGVMQMGSARPLSDTESVTAAAEAYADHWTLTRSGDAPYQHWSTDLGRAWSAVTTHNGDARFAENVATVAQHLIGADRCFFYFGDDHKTAVLELRRYAGRFALRGVSSSTSLLPFEFTGSAELKVLEPIAAAARSNDGWWSWELDFDPSADRVVLVDVPSMLALAVKLTNGEIAGIEPADIARVHGRGSLKLPTLKNSQHSDGPGSGYDMPSAQFDASPSPNNPTRSRYFSEPRRSESMNPSSRIRARDG